MCISYPISLFGFDLISLFGRSNFRMTHWRSSCFVTSEIVPFDMFSFATLVLLLSVSVVNGNDSENLLHGVSPEHSSSLLEGIDTIIREDNIMPRKPTNTKGYSKPPKLYRNAPSAGPLTNITSI